MKNSRIYCSLWVILVGLFLSLTAHVTGQGLALERFMCGAETAVYRGEEVLVRLPTRFTIGQSGLVVAFAFTESPREQVLVAKEPGGELEIILRQGDAVPGLPAGATIKGIGDARISDSDKLAVAVALDGPGFEFQDNAFLVGARQELRAVAYSGMERAGDQFFNYLDGSMGLSGKVVVAGSWSERTTNGQGQPITRQVESGVWFDQVTGSPDIDGSKDYPDMPRGFFGPANGMIVNKSGGVLFPASAHIGTVGDTLFQRAWFLAEEDVVRPLARIGESAPGTEATYAAIFAAGMTPSGWIWFRAQLEGPGIDTSNDIALFAHQDGTTFLVVREEPGAAWDLNNPPRGMSDSGTVLLQKDGRELWKWSPNSELEKVADTALGAMISAEGRIAYSNTDGMWLSGVAGVPELIYEFDPEGEPARLSIELEDGSVRTGIRSVEPEPFLMRRFESAFDGAERVFVKAGTTACRAWLDTDAPLTDRAILSGSVRDENSAGVRGIAIDLFRVGIDEPLETVLTSINGLYEFVLEESGDYLIVVDLPEDRNFLEGDGRREIDAVVGEVRGEIDFVLEAIVDPKIRGVVLADDNGNLVSDATDKAAINVTVGLYADAGATQLLATTLTNTEGTFTFESPGAGTYHLRVAETNQLVVLSTNPLAAVMETPTASFDTEFLIYRVPQIEIDVVMRRVDAGGIANLSERWHTTTPPPLVPVTDESVLVQQAEINGGLVADGVTPLLLELRPKKDPEAPAIMNMVLVQGDGGALNSGSVANRLALLEDGVWRRGLTRVRFDQDQTVRYALIWPIAADDLVMEPESIEVSMQLILADFRTGWEHARQPLRLRKPPIALVHGYNTRGDWGDKFVNELTKNRPIDFATTIRYGQDPSLSERLMPSTVLPFRILLQELDFRIDQAMEAIREEWAFTRHDVICHSQGGVLVRMLCSRKPPEAFLDHGYVDVTNMNRGRFHRVVTIGTPHVGSRLVRYMIELQNDENWSWGHLSSVISYGGIALQILQDKFDPFGPQIREIHNGNGPWRVDSSALFHFVQTTVNQGMPPSAASASFGHRRLALGGPVGRVVLPFGSDGVVDFGSMGVRSDAPNRFRVPLTAEISHSGPARVFSRSGLFPDTTGQVEADLVARHVRMALDQQGTKEEVVFARYPTPILPGELERRAIAEAAAGRVVFDNAEDGIQAAAANNEAGNKGNASVYTLVASLVQGQPLAEGTSVFWDAELYGIGGIHACETTPDPDNALKATLTMPENFVGDLVVHASYQSSTGAAVYLLPKLIDSREPDGLAVEGVRLVPDALAPAVGRPILATLEVDYSDGTVASRYLRPGMVTSTNEQVIDVSAGRIWTVLQPGDAGLTVSFDGREAVHELEVKPAEPFEPLPVPMLGNSELRLRPRGVELTLKDEAGPVAIEQSQDLLQWDILYDTGSDTNLDSPLVLEREVLGDTVRLLVTDAQNTRSGYFRLVAGIPPTSAVPVTGTTTLTFDLDGFGNFSNIDQGYGDRVTATTMDGFSYGGADGFTPNVEVSYGPDGSDPAIWTTGYGDLENILFEDRDRFGQLEITFAADEGFLVSLQRWDMAAFTSEFGEAPTINEVSVRDGDGNVLLSETDVPIAIEGHTQYDFTDEPLEATVLVLKFDSANLGNLSDDIAIDNIVIGQRPAP